MTDEEIDQAIECALSGIEGNGRERASAAEWPEVEADMALVERLGTFAKAARALAQRVVHVNDMSEWNLAGLADTARAILADETTK